MKTPEPAVVAVVQMRCGESPAENIERAAAHIRAAAVRGARVVCLPELFRTRYFCRRRDPTCFELSEPVPGPTTEALAGVARETGCALIVPLFERAGNGLYYNTAAVLDPEGRLAGRYRKMHIPEDPGFHEQFYFTPGKAARPVFRAGALSFGVQICWDQWFPEAARGAALRGIEVLFYPSAIGWLEGEEEQGLPYLEAWRTIQRGHAIANGMVVAAVNRVGEEHDGEGPAIRFWGGSFIAGPMGTIEAEAPRDAEAVLTAAIDPKGMAETRRTWPFFRDRRGEVYAEWMAEGGPP